MPPTDSDSPYACRVDELNSPSGEFDGSKRPKIAAIITSYFPTSHASHLVDKFLLGFPTDQGHIAPRSEIASLYIDQIHEDDIGRQVAKKFDIPLYESIRSALTLGGRKLAVDAVLVVGEHGDYPRSRLGQEMLPRRYFFEQIAGVLGEAGRSIPIYNDKHLSYRWDHATWMFETAASMRIPLWAASALPVVWRNPNWQHPADQPVDRALVISFHMLERYGYHALEILQCQIERRRGGETGVRSVQCLSGEDVWDAGRKGRWSMPLADAALAAIENGPGKLDPTKVVDPHVFLIDYVDGLQAAILNLGDNEYVQKFAYAQQRGDTIDSVEFHTDPIDATFGYLCLNIEEFFITGVPPSPIERTYLTTGILEAAMISRGESGRRIETPHLASIHYKATERVQRPTNTRPSGASLMEWNVLEPGATSAAESIPINRNGTLGGKRRIQD